MQVYLNSKRLGPTGDGGVFLDKDIVNNPSPSFY